jgi:hypothetical protein
MISKLLTISADLPIEVEGDRRRMDLFEEIVRDAVAARENWRRGTYQEEGLELMILKDGLSELFAFVVL